MPLPRHKALDSRGVLAREGSAYREVAEAAALKFLEHAHADFVAAVELKDVAPLLEAMGVYEGLVKLCVAKADAKARPPACARVFCHL